jgi:hypothetical protein
MGETTIYRYFRRIILARGIFVLCLTATAAQADSQPPSQWSDAIELSSFGERPGFSLDGSRVAFVGESYGDAFEIDLRTRQVRNLTGHAPHQGVLRVQYLASGDYLITAPRTYSGASSRGKAELWVLDSKLERGLVPLGEIVSEGTAVSRLGNRIAFTKAAQPFDPKKPLKSSFYVADIAYEGDVPKLVGKRKITVKGQCDGETQDFRDNDRELTISCYEWPSEQYGFGAAAYGVVLDTGELHKYRDIATEYDEIEGVAPDGTWSAVECSPRAKGGANVGLEEVSKNPGAFLNPIDLCRLDMKPGGALTVLFKATAPGSMRKANNPVVSPDGKWIAFAAADNRSDAGAGDGIFLLKVAE